MIFDWQRILRFVLFVATLLGWRVAMRSLANMIPAGSLTWLTQSIGAEAASHAVAVVLVALMVACALVVYWLASKALGIPMRDAPSGKTSSV